MNKITPNETRDQVPTYNGRFEKYNDMGNAARLVGHFGHKLRYVPGWGWMIYDGKRWKQDETGQVIEFAKETVRRMHVESADIPEDDDENGNRSWTTRNAYIDWAKKSGSAYSLEQAVKLARSDSRIAATADLFDADPMLLNVQNGTLNLRTKELQPHNPADLLTKIAAVNYNPHAKSEEWERFLNGVIVNDREETMPDVIAFLQRAIGYSLTGSVKEPAFFIPYGTGRNGKSTLLNNVAKVLGDYSAVCNKSALLKKERSDKIPNDIARLAGARIVLSSETEAGERLDISLIKQATGGDKITARFLNKEFFEFQPQMKIWLATNNKPEIPEATNAIWERVYLIPFNAYFPEGKADKDLPEKLEAEAEAILTWAVEGCYMWLEMRGLCAPQSIKDATTAYREEQNIIGEFLGDRCVLIPEARTPSRDVYNEYKDWCSVNHGHPMGDKEFKRQLEQQGFKSKRDKEGIKWHGIGLQKDQSKAASESYKPRQPIPSYLRAVNGEGEEPEDSDLNF